MNLNDDKCQFQKISASLSETGLLTSQRRSRNAFLYGASDHTSGFVEIRFFPSCCSFAFFHCYIGSFTRMLLRTCATFVRLVQSKLHTNLKYA